MLPFLIFGILSATASARGQKSPLYGAFGVGIYFAIIAFYPLGANDGVVVPAIIATVFSVGIVLFAIFLSPNRNQLKKNSATVSQKQRNSNATSKMLLKDRSKDSTNDVKASSISRVAPAVPHARGITTLKSANQEFKPVTPHLPERKWPTKSQGRSSEFPYGCVAVVFFILSIVGIGFAIYMSVKAALLDAAATRAGQFFAEADAAARHLRQVGESMFMISIVIMAGAFACLRLHRRQSLPSAEAVMRADTRAPILYLRSFKIDTIQGPAGFSAKVLPSFSGEKHGAESFESLLTPGIKKMGPFIAVGNPDDYLPTMGAAKMYRSHTDWKTTVSDLMKRASIMIVVEGNTDSLKWELKEIRSVCAPRKVFLITPTTPFRTGNWGNFQTMVSECGFQVQKLNPGPGAVLAFDDHYQSIYIHSGYSEPSAMGSAIERWIHTRNQIRRA